MKTCEIKELRNVKGVDDNIDNILKQYEGHRVQTEGRRKVEEA